MAFYCAYFLKFFSRHSIMHLPGRFGKVNNAFVTENTSEQGISSETALCLPLQCDYFQFSKRESNGRGIGKLRKHFGD